MLRSFGHLQKSTPSWLLPLLSLKIIAKVLSCDRKITSLKTFKSFHPLISNCQTTDCKGSFDYCAYKFHTICLLSSRWKGSLKAASIFCLFLKSSVPRKIEIRWKERKTKNGKKKVVSQEQTNYICILKKSGTYHEPLLK